jgi:FlaA1/EpsC-like NDP-sugar epimerase
MLFNLRGMFSGRPAVRGVIILAFDALFVCLSLTFAYLLRFEGDVPTEFARAGLIALPVFVAVRLLLSVFGGLHRWSFRMSGLSEATRLVTLTGLGTAFIALILFAIQRSHMPRSVVALEFFFTWTFMAGLRFAPRLITGWFAEQRRSHGEGAFRTLIIGAGDAGDLLLRDLNRAPEHHYHIVGFIDDDNRKQGLSVGGKPVLGSIDSLPVLVRRYAVQHILIAIPRLSADRIRFILRLCSALKVSFKIIPASFSYLDEKVASAMLHDLSPEDLLPRDQVQFDAGEIQSLVGGRCVLVTGGGGSIGGEIARQVARYGARKLVLVDMNENSLYLLARRLRQEYAQLELHTEIADIREPAKLLHLGEMYKPQDVFHAAAHKHVPLMEDAPEEAIKNNVLGTMNVAQMAIVCGVERFVFISTDKAVRPSSVMGASKRLAELAIRHIASGAKTKFVVVRFGNVLGSAGSVVPLFKEQIERGGPVTVTHPDCTRYFMTIPEAVGLVLIAGLGGYGELCILEMGEAIRIVDLATHMITMAGHVAGGDIPIVFTGLRPGEKIAEEIFTEEEEETQIARNRILVAKSPPPPTDLTERIQHLREVVDMVDRDGIRRILREILPSYRPTEVPPAVVLPMRRSSTGRFGR